jgi:hypothetical protein
MYSLQKRLSGLRPIRSVCKQKRKIRRSKIRRTISYGFLDLARDFNFHNEDSIGEFRNLELSCCLFAKLLPILSLKASTLNEAGHLTNHIYLRDPKLPSIDLDVLNCCKQLALLTTFSFIARSSIASSWTSKLDTDPFCETVAYSNSHTVYLVIRFMLSITHTPLTKLHFFLYI